MPKNASWDETVQRPLIAKIERWGRRFFYWLASLLISSELPEPFSFDNVKSILLIKEPYRMGDLMQITPTLRALRKSFPECFIGLLIQDRNLPVFQYNTDINQIFSYEKNKINRGPWMIFSFLRSIRKRKFDLAVTLETQRTHLTNDLLAYFSGARFRLRYDGAKLGHSESNLFYNLLVPMENTEMHEVEWNFGVFKPFGLKLENMELILKVSDKEMTIAKDIISNTLDIRTSDFFVIHPGAYKLNNRWPLENYFQVGKKIREKGNLVLFIVGPAEAEWKPEIEKQGFPVISGISVLEMAAILKLSSGVLCNDTGVMHIAGGAGVKTIALFGDTYPERWKPPGTEVQVIQAPDKRLSSITIENVLSLLIKKIK